jgi:hypothetical protein
MPCEEGAIFTSKNVPIMPNKGVVKAVEMTHKAAEIADSDGESDFDIAPSSLPSPQSHKKGESSLPSIGVGVNFNEFLGQSQNYGVNRSQQSAPEEPLSEVVAEKSTGTTASLKRQIESEQQRLAQHKSSSSGRLSDNKIRSELHSSDSPIVAKTKRRHSELLTAGQMDGGRDTKRKRQKSYGSSGSQFRSSQSEIFMDERRELDQGSMDDRGSSIILEHSSDQPEDNSQLVDEVHQREIEHQSYSTEGQLASHEQDRLQPQLPGPSVGTDAFKDYTQRSTGRISTTRSLMGNYESINLDFSGSGPGLDINTNPFGDASQQSAEDRNEQTERMSLEAIFRPSNAGTISVAPFSDDRDSHAYNSFEQNLSGLGGADSLREAHYSRQTPGRSKSYIDPSVLTKIPPDNTQELSPSKSSSSRKRRKTDDGLVVQVGSTLQGRYDLQPTTDAHDSIPAISETQVKKRGRKPKNHTFESTDELVSEQAQGQEKHGKTASTKTGPMEKHSPSEPNLDDESTIGLPQEQYKPRPSRSRSKRTVEEAMPPPALTPIKSVQIPTKEAHTPNPDDTVQLEDPEDTPLTKLKKEKRKMNKMKRAKTSAAALLKKSDKMLSDGEEDVVWVESKPATVKMKVPNALEVKREQAEKDEDDTPSRIKADQANAPEAAMDEQSLADAPHSAAEISVDIPQTEEKPQAQVPKKRGRKKKAAIELPFPAENEDDAANPSNAAAEPNEATPTEDQEPPNQLNPKTKPSSSRHALSEKDVNTSHPAQPQSGDEDQPPKATPTSPPKNDTDRSHASIEPPESQAALQPPPTPTPQPQTTTKGPTKHSPINPSGGKVKYRVGLSRRATISPLLKIVRKQT